jgi:hypothetical protein
MKSVTCSFHQPPVTSSLLGVKLPLNILSANILIPNCDLLGYDTVKSGHSVGSVSQKAARPL